MPVLGIDIGGSGIKGNLVDVETGELLAERFKIFTPQPATPEAVATSVAEIVEHFNHLGVVGCAFPAIVKRGVTLSAANVDESWIGLDADALFEEFTGRRCTVLNDADAAGSAEMRFGAGRGRKGVVLMLTLGTGIGSAMFNDGVLVPNTELGHIQFGGHPAVEDFAAASVRKIEDLSWEEWGMRLDACLRHLDRLFSPDLFIIGGGISKDWEKYSEFLAVSVETIPAELRNEAGIVGAAMAAAEES